MGPSEHIQAFAEDKDLIEQGAQPLWTWPSTPKGCAPGIGPAPPEAFTENLQEKGLNHILRFLIKKIDNVITFHEVFLCVSLISIYF